MGRVAGALSSTHRTAFEAELRDVNQLYHGFSCPQEEAFDDDFLRLVVTEHARQTVRELLRRYPTEVEHCGRGFVQLLEGWLKGPTDVRTTWDVAFGYVFEAIQSASNRTRTADRLVRFGLRLSARGARGDWEARLATPARLTWDNCLLPLADAISVETSGAGARVRLRCGRKRTDIRFHKSRAGWTGAADKLPSVVAARERILLLPLEALIADDIGDALEMVIDPAGAGPARAWLNTIALLKRHAPPYLRWSTRLVRKVVLLRHETERIRSGSRPWRFGLVHMSCSPNAAAMAEMLIHEASHQYYHVLTRLGPVDDGSDRTLYYSPAKRTGRPLDRILLAYHAFANVLLFYRLCRESGAVDRAHCDWNIAHSTEMLDELVKPLRRNPALTPVGRALCEPLMERVN